MSSESAPPPYCTNGSNPQARSRKLFEPVFEWRVIRQVNYDSSYVLVSTKEGLIKSLACRSSLFARTPVNLMYIDTPR